MKGKGLSLCVGIAVILLLVVEARGAWTNDLDGTRNFSELVERIQSEYPKGIRYNTNGAVVYLAVNYVSDDNLTLISREPSIRELCLLGGNMTDKGIAALQQMTNLDWLKIAHSNAVHVASPLKQLRRLDLWCSMLKPADLPYLIQMTNLVELRIRGGWNLGSNAILALTNLTQLKKLEFGGGWYPDNNKDYFSRPIDDITNLARLEELELRGFRSIEDNELRKLASLPNLKSLNLDDIQVSDNWTNIVREFPALTNAAVYIWPDPKRKTKTWVRGR